MNDQPPYIVLDQNFQIPPNPVTGKRRYLLSLVTGRPIYLARCSANGRFWTYDCHLCGGHHRHRINPRLDLIQTTQPTRCPVTRARPGGWRETVDLVRLPR